MDLMKICPSKQDWFLHGKQLTISKTHFEMTNPNKI